MVYIGTNNFSLDGGLLNDGLPVRGFYGQDGVNVAFDLGGGGSGGGGSITGGGGTTISISNQPGLANSNIGKLIYIESKIDGCSIIKNGNNTFATTNNSIRLTTEELTIAPVTITLSKTGYTFKDEYRFDVVTNPNYVPQTTPTFSLNVDPFSSLYNYQNFNLPNQQIISTGDTGRIQGPTGVTFFGQPYVPDTTIKEVYSTQPTFVIRVKHLLNGIEQVFDYDAGSPSLTIKFDNAEPEIKEVVLEPPVLPSLFKVAINLNGINESVQLLATSPTTRTVPINLLKC